MIPSAEVKVSKLIIVTGGIVLIELCTALTLVPLTDRTRVQPTDFVNFYVGASIVRNG